MQPKQREMDGIIERIYKSFDTNVRERTLIVVCGDHGMNDVCPLPDIIDIRLVITADLLPEKRPQ
jgi:arylsulfatase A-like enzyme